MHADNLTTADSSDVVGALAFALRFQGRKRVHNADEIMAEIVAKAWWSIWNGPALS